jgi:diphosphomevalonate decarboxylase
VTARPRAARAVAHANIALVKYWGKLDRELNLPAVPSLSLTLDRLRTTTRVELDPALGADEALLDGRALSGSELERVSRHLDRLRLLTGETCRARVESVNGFATAAGLASSASGFAALTVATARALGQTLDAGALSALARQGSASAARSIFGGYAALRAGAHSAERVAPGDALDIRLLVAVTTPGPKPIGSTEAMLRTEATSPYYSAWVTAAPALFDRGLAAIQAGDLAALGRAMEQSTLAMHASMMAADPPIVYWRPATLEAMACARELRAGGTTAYFTMNTGPHVKVLVLSRDAAEVAARLRAVAGVSAVVECAPGPDAHEVADESPVT